MSQIKINKVDSLKKEREEIQYKDLSPKTAFIWVNDRNKKISSKYIRIRTGSGHVNEDFEHFAESEYSGLVIPVDAELNWAYQDGGGE